jgi:hypothetical protein
MMTLDELKELGLSEEEAMLFLQQAAGMSSEDEGGMYEAAAAIGALSGPEREKAIAELSTNYEGRKESLRDDLTMSYDQYSSPTPEGRMTSGNQFGYYQAASPLEHIASGMQKYMGGKGMKEARTEREKLSAMQESGQGRVLNSMADDINSPETAGMTPEEKRLWLLKQRAQAKSLWMGSL